MRLASSIQGQNRIVKAIQILLRALLRFHQSPYYEDFFIQFACLCFELSERDQWARVLSNLPWSLESCSDVYRAKIDYLLGLASLIESDYFKGWSLLERRFVAGLAEYPEIFRKRRLTPDCLDQVQQILLFVEPGGAGDVIFSLRFLPRLRARVRHVQIICDSAFFDFFRATRLFDAVNLWQDVDALDPSVHALSINSLPWLLGLGGPETSPLVPINIPSIDGKGFWSTPRSVRSKPQVALNWQGDHSKESLSSAGIRGRSLSAALCQQIQALKHCDLISVQVGDRCCLSDDSSWAPSFVPGQRSFSSTPHHYLKTARVLCGFDLLITNDTSVAHLGGVMGLHTWVLLNRHPYWQWGRDGDRSPWYDSVRCFRQRVNFDWSAVIAEVDQALTMWISDWHTHRSR